MVTGIDISSDDTSGSTCISCLEGKQTWDKILKESVRGPNDGLGNQTGRTSNSSKTTEAKGHGSKPLVSRVG